MLTLEVLMKRQGEFEAAIGYTFTEEHNALLALTHSSYANENRHEKLECNERLEFLGDAVLNLTISDTLYRKFPNLTEGEMSRLRSCIVCEQSLMHCAEKINLGQFLLLGKGEEHTGGRTRPSILCDAFESVIGAIYLDGGMEKARSFIIAQMMELIDQTKKGNAFTDYKTRLQEEVHKHGDINISYEVIDEKGPDHDKLFVSQVSFSGRIAGQGKGRTKKEAEQNAAKAAIKKLEEKQGSL